MSATKITDLLPIPAGTRQPHPYQVLGLEDGEQDQATIESAIASIVTRLKEAKEEADPNVWTQAAKLVKGAQKVLADPESKARLDARFGIVSIDPADGSSQDSSADSLAAFLPTSDPLSADAPLASGSPFSLEAQSQASGSQSQASGSQSQASGSQSQASGSQSQASGSQSQDPLAAILPTANPLAPANSNPIEAAFARQPASTTPAPIIEPVAAGVSDLSTSDSNAMPPGLFGTPNLDPNSGSGSDGTINAPSPVVVSKPQSHRKRSMMGTLLFVLFAFATFGVIGALAYLKFFGSGQIAVTKNQGKITISTEPPATKPATEVAKPRPVEPREKKPSDPVMGNLTVGDPSDGVTGRPSSGLTSGGLTSGGLTSGGLTSGGLTSGGLTSGGPAMSSIEMSLESMTPDGASSVQASVGDPAEMGADMQTDPIPEMQPEETPLTDAMIASAEEELEKIRELIRTSAWREMKPAAEAILQQRLSDEQQAEAQSLYELADLATYYRGGIEQAIAGLNVGNDFQVSDGIRLIIVETGPDLLVVRHEARNHSYTLDKLPLPLAHRLATFQMPDTPAAQAAKAVYQAIAPNLMDGYRMQAIGWLGEIQGEVEGADPERLAETIRSLYEEL